MSTRKLAAIMFTDMVGYTALMQENEQLALEKRRHHKLIFDKSLTKFNGTLLQQYGDGTLSIFPSGVNAILCAIQMQTLNKQENIDVRIGIHTGDILTDENGIYGDSVNIASRIESLAVPGSILISEKLFDEIKNQEGISAKTLGYFELKNVRHPVQVYAVSNTGIRVPQRDDLKGKVKEASNSIAVIPFASMSSDPENEYFCDGMTEEIINVLSKIDGLRVTSRISSFAFKGRHEDVREIAAKLNVQKILEGSVRKGKDKVRITAQLINASDGFHVWSETYDRSIEDIFEVQDDISRTIANKLRENLTSVEHERTLVKAPTENLDAYKKYLQGLHHWNKQTIQDIMKALQCFNEAIELQPDFATPYGHITYINGFFGLAGIIKVEDAEKACRITSEKAMQLDPANPWSLLASAIYSFYFKWDMAQTEVTLAKAVELNPNLAAAHLCYAWYYMAMQEIDKIQDALKKATALDPVGGETMAGAGEMSLFSWNFEKAGAFCDEALANDPHNMYAGIVKGLVVGFTGDWMEAIDRLEPIYHKAPYFNLAAVYLGFAYAKAGNVAKAKEFIQLLEEKQKNPSQPALFHLLAILYLAVGEKEKFYENYEASVKDRSIACLLYYNSPIMADAMNDERLRSLRIEHGLPV